MSWTEWLMIFLAAIMAATVMIAMLLRERRNDCAAIEWMTIALVVFALLIWAQHRAERAHELKHAAEYRAVQEQMKSVQNF